MNLSRRDLTRQQKRDTITRFIELYPQASDRHVAKQLERWKVDHKMRSVAFAVVSKVGHRPTLRPVRKNGAKAALAENPGASIADIAKQTGVSRRTVVSAKKELSEPRPEPKPEPEEKPEPEPAPKVSDAEQAMKKLEQFQVDVHTTFDRWDDQYLEEIGVEAMSATYTEEVGARLDKYGVTLNNF